MSGPYLLDVSFTVADGGAGVVTVPSQTVQAVIGTAASGTVGQVIPTRSLDTLRNTFLSGPVMEASGLVIQAGGTVLAVRATTTSPGVLDGLTAISGGIVSSTMTTPIVVTVGSTSTIISGSVVVVASHLVNTAANGTWRVTVIDGTTFSLDDSVGNGVGINTGTATPTGSVATIATASTGAMWFTGIPTDDCWPMAVVQTGFTEGAAGGTVLLSLDAGKHFGPPIPVGTAATVNLKDAGGYDSGLVLNFSASKVFTGGGIVNGAPAGDYCRAHGIAPQPNAAGITAAITALVAYISSSAGVFPILQVCGNFAAADATTFQTNMMTLEGEYLFERLLISSRDAHAPTAWGGQSAETEAVWEAAVLLDFSATVARRVCASAGWYNMPTAFPTSFASAPAQRRPLSFALGARQVAIQPQTMAAKVGGALGGNISQIVVSPGRDPYDGFIYHDETLSPAFCYVLAGATGRFAAAMTHKRKAGLFFAVPLTLAPQGSDFSYLPRGLVMDVACTIAHDVLSDFIAADFTTKPNGTLTDNAANTIWGKLYNALYSGMTGVGMVSGFTILVDQTTNLQITPILTVTITILGVAYILQINVPIGYTNALAATAA